MQSDTHTDPDIETVRAELAAAGRRRSEGRQEATDAMQIIRQYVPIAKRLHMSPSEIAELAQVTRETVYQIIGTPAKEE